MSNTMTHTGLALVFDRSCLLHPHMSAVRSEFPVRRSVESMCRQISPSYFLLCIPQIYFRAVSPMCFQNIYNQGSKKVFYLNINIAKKKYMCLHEMREFMGGQKNEDLKPVMKVF